MYLWLLATLVSLSEAAAPCDIFQEYGTPCVAAHSIVRALYADFHGPLYAVRRFSDRATLDIYTLKAGGVADAASQDLYCAGKGGCTISTIYDQSPEKNHLIAGLGRREHLDLEVNASKELLRVYGERVYGAYVEKTTAYPNSTCSVPPCEHAKEVGVGYRINITTGMAKGDNLEIPLTPTPTRTPTLTLTLIVLV